MRKYIHKTNSRRKAAHKIDKTNYSCVWVPEPQPLGLLAPQEELGHATLTVGWSNEGAIIV